MKFFVFLSTLFSVFLIMSCNSAPPPISLTNRSVSVNGIRTNEPMPPTKPVEEMSWKIFDPRTNVDGNDIKMKSLQGKVVILDFWATYCPPCIEGIPHLNDLQTKYGRENLEIVGLHVGGTEDRPQVPAFADRLKISYTLATPEDELTNFIFGNRSDIPQTAVFDRKGRLVEKFIGFSDGIKKDLDAAVEKAFNTK